MAGTLVVIPTYNERENLADTVARVRAAVPEASVLVVDDSSPDGTGVLADELAAADAAVHVLHRTAKDGLGAAYLEAFGWALDQGYDPIVQLDADGSHLPEQLPRLLEGARGHGCRGPARRPRDRVAVDPGRVDRELAAPPRAALAVGQRVRPHAAAPRHARCDGGVPGRSGPMRCAASGSRTCTRAGTASRWTCSGTRARPGLVVVEVPVTFVERVHGRSKMSPAIVLEATARVTAWGLRSRVRPPRCGAARERRPRVVGGWTLARLSPGNDLGLASMRFRRELRLCAARSGTSCLRQVVTGWLRGGNGDRGVQHQGWRREDDGRCQPRLAGGIRRPRRPAVGP